MRTWAYLWGALLLAGIVGALRAENPPTSETRNSDTAPKPAELKPKIVMATDLKPDQRGLKIVGPTRLSASAEHPDELTFTIVNCLEQEAFVEVTRPFPLPLDLEGDQGFLSSGTVGNVFPDNTSLLKRLHASEYGPNGRRTCGCAFASIRASINLQGIDLKDWVGANAIVTLPVRGYVRDTGEYFLADMKFTVPIEK